MSATNNLSDAGKIAHQAFLDMGESKKKHFSCLENLEEKYKSGGVPSIQEKLELEQLLSIHDKNVAAFKTAMAAIVDDEEKKRLIDLIS